MIRKRQRWDAINFSQEVLIILKYSDKRLLQKSTYFIIMKFIYGYLIYVISIAGTIVTVTCVDNNIYFLIRILCTFDN